MLNAGCFSNLLTVPATLASGDYLILALPENQSDSSDIIHISSYN